MTLRTMTHRSRFRTLAVSLVVIFCTVIAAPEAEPIAYIGHGAFFDREGKQIEVTPEFIARRAELLPNKQHSIANSWRLASMY